MSNHYETLGVPEDADEQAIKKAYRRLAVEWHPDKHQGKDSLSEAESKFKGMTEAYTILGNAEKRREYDLSRKGGNPFSFATTGDPFEFFFSHGHSAFRQRQPSGPQPRNGHNVQLEHVLSLADAVFGTQLSIEYPIRIGCDDCGMRGYKVFETCSACKGSGFVVQRQANMIMQTTCTACQGQGSLGKEACPTCNGLCVRAEHKRLLVDFPPGLHTGSVLRLRGQGGPGFLGGSPGDVLMAVRVSYPDPSKLTDEQKVELRNLLNR